MSTECQVQWEGPVASSGWASGWRGRLGSKDLQPLLEEVVPF